VVKTANNFPFDWPVALKPRRDSKRARFLAVQEAWRDKYNQRQQQAGRTPPGELVTILLENLAAGKYDPSRKITPQTAQEVLGEMFPNVRAANGLTNSEPEMVTHMVRTHPDISDRTLRIYIGLMRGNMSQQVTLQHE
jgi:hypothetical protein